MLKIYAESEKVVNNSFETIFTENGVENWCDYLACTKGIVLY